MEKFVIRNGESKGMYVLLFMRNMCMFYYS